MQAIKAKKDSTSSTKNGKGSSGKDTRSQEDDDELFPKKVDTEEQAKRRSTIEGLLKSKCQDLRRIQNVLDELMEHGPHELDLIRRVTEHGAATEKKLREQETSSSDEETKDEESKGGGRGFLGRLTPWRR